jgi:Cu(I)/Ag(I) efflux system protein CusF
VIRRDILMAIVALATMIASAAPAPASDTTQPAEKVLSAGRVVKVEAEAGKITIEHKPIWRLYMEAMTMTFKVRDATMLTGLTPGDRIRFKVDRAGDGFVVTRIENANR